MLVRHFKGAGVSTAYIGKWHLDSPYRPYVPGYNNTEEYACNEWTTPERRHGFDFWYAYGIYDLHLELRVKFSQPVQRKGKQLPRYYRSRTPAMAVGLASRRWSVLELISYPLP